MVNLVTSVMAAGAPTGFWPNIIFAFSNAVKNYALAIILIALCIKVLLLPLDFFQKRGQAKMQDFQDKNGKKMQEIQRKYQDKTLQNQKLGELYKKEGFNPMGACLPMLIAMALNLAVFFTLFGSLNGISAYKITNQYEQLQQAYITDYAKQVYSLTDEQIADLKKEEVEGYILEIAGLDQSVEENVITLTKAQNAVKEKYQEVKESFLWIKNVWIADSPMARAIPNFDSYAATAGLKFTEEEQELKENAEKVYNAVMADLEKTEGVNGYFVLAVLAALSTFLSQYFASKKKKQKQNFYAQQNSENQQQKSQAVSNKAMLIIFPIIMLFFTLSYNAIFAMYIVVSNLVLAASAPLINKLIAISLNKKESKPNKVK